MLSFNTVASTQVVDKTFFKRNTKNIEFPIHFRTVSNDADVNVFVKPLFESYHQCIIKTTCINSDTLIVELDNTTQTIEKTENFSITTEKYVCLPTFFFINVVTKNISFKICKIVVGEKEIVFRSRH